MAPMKDILGQAWESLCYNRRRAMLTMLGMAWGIATVVLLMAYGAGFSNAIANIFRQFGMHSIGFWGGRTSMQAGGNKAGVSVRFTLEDMDRLCGTVPQINHITPEDYFDAMVSYGGRGYTWTLRANYPSYQVIGNITMEQGRYFTAEDLAQRARVVVLGPEARDKLFTGRYPIGEMVRLQGIPYEVIGVYRPKSQESDNDDNNRQVFIPYTAMSDFRGIHFVDGFWLDYEGEDYVGVEQGIRRTLAAQYNFRAEDKRAIHMANMMDQLSMFRIMGVALQILLAFIGTLTLGIGGVGLMNIMLVSVTQRTREIGVEKALGARRRDILMQFLSEAMVITFTGGVLGILFAYALSHMLGTITLYSAIAKHGEVGDIHLLISPLTVVVATVILALVGVVSGMVPAIRASRLDPIEALRYE